MKNKILSAMSVVATNTSSNLIQNINDNTILLESGLDSLGFAILVAQLEEDLGYDPFSMMAEPVYPRTFGELVEIYERFSA